MTLGAFQHGNFFWRWVKSSLGLTEQAVRQGTWADQYEFLKGYYHNNGLYADLTARARVSGVSMQVVRSLRNPVRRAVEFYPMKLWPGTLPQALPIVSKNTKLSDEMQKIYTWSNWNTEKQAAARSAAMLGDMVIKVATVYEGETMKRVFMQNIDPACMTEVSVDERSYLTYVRTDIPQLRRDNLGKEIRYYVTEVWDKATGIMRQWVHEQTAYSSLEALGEPMEIRTFESMGVTFIPIVWQPFIHVNDERGASCFTHAIEKIDEVNRQATQLHSMLFRYNKPLWVASSDGRDAAGREIPPPKFAGGDGSTLKLNTRPGEEDIVRLSGTQRLDSLVPSIDFGSHLASIQDMMRELSYDLPEMVAAELHTRAGDLSGVAIRYLLDAAIDKLLEARGNLEGALIRAQQMALTIGMAGGLIANLGTYEEGALDHTFAERDVLNTPEKERAELLKLYIDAGVPLPIAAKRAGWSQEEIDELVEEQEKADEKKKADMAEALLNATEQMDGDESPQATEPTANEEAPPNEG
jgi:hypothetical protein